MCHFAAEHEDVIRKTIEVFNNDWLHFFLSGKRDGKAFSTTADSPGDVAVRDRLMSAGEHEKPHWREFGIHGVDCFF